MTKFKLEKQELSFNRIIWHYRDFIIADERLTNSSPYPVWTVFNTKIVIDSETNEIHRFKGTELYKNGNGTRKEMIEWIDRYYKEMNDYVTNEMYKVGEA